MLKYRGQQINDTDVSIGKTAPQMRTIPVNVRECSASYCQLKLPADPWGSLKEEVYPAAQEVYDVFLHRSELWLFHPFICLLLLPLPSFFLSYSFLLLTSKSLLPIYVSHFHLFRSVPAAC